jgi:hypothetical protein
MSALSRWIPGTLIAVAFVLAVGFLSQRPLPGEPPEEAALRLSWRVRGEEVGECPRPTAADLARLPAHMQNPDACLGPLPTYRLQVRLDGEAVIDRRVEGAGARGDRPLYVLEELRLDPDTFRIEVDFRREEGTVPLEDPGTALVLDATLALEPGTVLLVTRAIDTGILEVRRPR